MTVASSEAKPHSHGKYLAVITLLALLVVALGGAAGYYYMNRTTVQAAKTAPPTLTTKLHSQQVSFTPWNDTVTFTSSSTYSCGANGPTIPGTIIIQAENFTENLSGRDPGSTWVNFRTVNGPIVVFNRTDLTLAFIKDALCGNTPPSESPMVVGSSPMWRVLSSGDYAMLIFYIQYTTPATTPFPGGVVSESWTVTTISTD